MGQKGLDFKHKEVEILTMEEGFGFVQDVTADLETGVITSIIVPEIGEKSGVVFQNISAHLKALSVGSYTLVNKDRCCHRIDIRTSPEESFLYRISALDKAVTQFF